MDLLPYPLVRPSVHLLSTTLSAHFNSRSRDGLLSTFIDLLFVAANGNHPDLQHGKLLQDLKQHLLLPRPSLTAPVYANVIRGGGSPVGGGPSLPLEKGIIERPLGNGKGDSTSRSGIRSMSALDSGSRGGNAIGMRVGPGLSTAEQTYKPLVFSLMSIRKLLMAIHTLPDEYKKEVEYLESLIVSRHLMEEPEFHGIQAGRISPKQESKEEERERKVKKMGEKQGEVKRTSLLLCPPPPTSSSSSTTTTCPTEREEVEAGTPVSEGMCVGRNAVLDEPPSSELVSQPLFPCFSAPTSPSSREGRGCWWRWWVPAKAPPRALYAYEEEFLDENSEYDDDEEDDEEHAGVLEGGLRRGNGEEDPTAKDGDLGEDHKNDSSSSRRGCHLGHWRGGGGMTAGGGAPKMIDIEWKDRPTFWGLAAQLRQQALVEAMMQGFNLEEHELESSAIQTNVVMQQRVLAYLCSTATRQEPAYFRSPIAGISSQELLSMVDSILSSARGVAGGGGKFPLSQARPSPSTSGLGGMEDLLAVWNTNHHEKNSAAVAEPSQHEGGEGRKAAVMEGGGREKSIFHHRHPPRHHRLPHLPVLCRPLPEFHSPLFLIQHYLGEETAWRWCAEALLHLQTGRIAKAGATNHMITGEGGNNTIIPAASSINAPTASEELLSMERTISSAPADFLPSPTSSSASSSSSFPLFSSACSLSFQSGGSTTVSGGSSSTSISFLRVGAVYSTTLLLASLTKHWPQDILPPDLLSSSVSNSLLGTAGCADYFITPSLRMLYELAAVLFELKPKFPFSGCGNAEFLSDKEELESKTTTATTTTTTTTQINNKRGIPHDAWESEYHHGVLHDVFTEVAGAGVTTMIPPRVQKAFLPVLRQTLWYFHSQSRLHDIADLYLFSSSWLLDSFPFPPLTLPRSPSCRTSSRSGSGGGSSDQEAEEEEKRADKKGEERETGEVQKEETGNALRREGERLETDLATWKKKLKEELNGKTSSDALGGQERHRKTRMHIEDEKGEGEGGEEDELDDQEDKDEKEKRNRKKGIESLPRQETPTEENITVGELMLLQQHHRWRGWLEQHLWLFPTLAQTARSQLGAAGCTVSLGSLPLCSTSSWDGGGAGGGRGGSGGSGTFTLPPPPKPTGLSASAAAALSLETLLSGLLSAAMLWQRESQFIHLSVNAHPPEPEETRGKDEEGTGPSATTTATTTTFSLSSSLDDADETRKALYQSISLYLRSLATQYLPPRTLSSSMSSGGVGQRNKNIASHWSYHHVVYLLVTLNTLLFPKLEEAGGEVGGVRDVREDDSSMGRTKTVGVKQEKQETAQTEKEERWRRRVPLLLPPLSFPEMAPLLDFCQQQLLSCEESTSSGYLTDKASTREISSLLLYASELLQSDTTKLVEELRLSLGTQKANRRRRRREEEVLQEDREGGEEASASASSSSLLSCMEDRPLYRIYQKGWELVASRATEGGFTSEALQLLLWKALNTLGPITPPPLRLSSSSMIKRKSRRGSIAAAAAVASGDHPHHYVHINNNDEVEEEEERMDNVHHYYHFVYPNREDRPVSFIPPFMAVDSLQLALKQLPQRSGSPLYA